MKLTELYTAKAIAAYFTEAVSNRTPYLGAGLFPASKKMGLDLAWIKGHKGLPVTLMPSTFDAKARYRGRIGISRTETEMPFFREGFLIKEKDRQELLRAKESKDPYVQDVITRLFDDAASLIDGAAVVPERMRMQLLAAIGGAPSIAIKANDTDYTYNYDPTGEFAANNYLQLTGASDKWSDTSGSDPLSDLSAAMESVEGHTGTRPSVALMSRKTFNYLLGNERIRSAILSQNVGANLFMTDQAVKTVLSQLLGLSIVIYTKKYVDDAGVTQPFYPDDRVTLLPSGAVGRTWYGTTPEEADLMGSAAASVRIVDTGVAITTIPIAHPVNIETIASEIVLPSFERMDEVYVLEVA